MKFSISILAMNGREMTQRCVNSVLKGGGSYELLLTDNASTDGTGAYFDSLASEKIKIIHNEKNLGFSEPNNSALQLASGRYFVTLNNDAVVPKGWLAKLEEPFKSIPTAAISGPSGSPCSLQAPYPSFHGSLGSQYEYVEGSCLCIPTALARKHGLFATYLRFAYCEDCDLSLRMRCRGLTIHQVPFQIQHIRSATAVHIPNMLEIQRYNHAAMVARWDNYLKFRRFDLPIVIRRRAAWGDVLHVTPLLRALRDQCPRSETFVETDLPAVFRNNANAKYVGRKGDFQHIYKWARFIELDMSYENQTNTHPIDGYFRTARIMASGQSRRCDIYPNEQELAAAAQKFTGDNWVAVHTGPSTWSNKTWYEVYWQEVIRYLMQKHRVVLVGNGGYTLPSTVDLRDKTTIHSLAAVLGRCRFFVGLDSFPIHVAQAMGIPVVGLFGVTSPEYVLSNESPWFAARATTPCAGARHRVLGSTMTKCDNACMKSISVESVINEIRKIE